MEIRANYKKYLVVAVKMPSLTEFVLISDHGDKEEALRVMDRSRGMVVVEIPNEVRLPEGGVFHFDTDKMKRVEKQGGIIKGVN